MFTRVLMSLGGLFVAGLMVLAPGGGGTALAFDPANLPDDVCPGIPGDQGIGDHPWLRLGIVESAAATIGITPREVVDGMREGHSLAEIAAVHGVGEFELKTGILRDERADLHRHVEAGHITHLQAHRAMHWLVVHIDRIVDRHHPCLADVELPPM